MKTTRDKGYAWVVLLATLVCNYLSGVLHNSVGIIQVVLLDKYHDDVTTTAWAGAVYSSLQLMGAPLSTWLVHRFGCRVSVVVGGVLLLIGFTVSAFTTSVLQLVFSYELVAGTGLGLTYSPTLMVIVYYFDKFRALASGISVSGHAVGILSGPLLTQVLIDTYGLTGAFLMIAGIGLNNCVFAMFFRPTEYEGWSLRTRQSSLKLGDINKGYTQDDEKDRSKNYCFDGTDNDASEPRKNVTYQTETSEKTIKDDSFQKTPAACNVCEHWENEELQSEVQEQNDGIVSNKTETPRNDRSRCSEKSVLSKVMGQFSGIIPLIKDRAFLSHCASVSCAGINISGVFLHLPEYSRTFGISPTEAAVLFVAVGILSFVSRFGSGLLLTSPRMNAFLLSVSLMGLCSGATSLFPLYSATYVGQMAFASLFGLSTGGVFTLINVQTVELVAFTNLSAAYGMLLFVMGVGYFAGPPLAGMIVDLGGTYEHSFIFLGVVMFASAAFDLLAKVLHTRRQKQQRHASHQDDRQGKQQEHRIGSEL